MTRLLSKTLSEILNEQPRAASVFDKFDLDYCCREKRSLQEACNEKGIPATTVIQMLEGIYSAKKAGLDFSRLKLNQLIDYIVHTHHSYLKEETPFILSRLEKMTVTYGHVYKELYRISELFIQLCNDLKHQLHREESILFPWIRQLDRYGYEPIPHTGKTNAFLQTTLTELEHNNDHSIDIMKIITKLINNFSTVTGSCTRSNSVYASLVAFESDLLMHTDLECKVLFPKVLKLEDDLRINALN